MIEAAGGVVWRRTSKGKLRVLLIHRPRYDDWSLPKGKLDPGESFEAAAVREVEEETGLRCRLGASLPPVRYTDSKGREKLVRYWAMEASEDAAGATFEPNDEVDEVEWASVSRATEILTYPHDVDVVRSAQRALEAPTQSNE